MKTVKRCAPVGVLATWHKTCFSTVTVTVFETTAGPKAGWRMDRARARACLPGIGAVGLRPCGGRSPAGGVSPGRALVGRGGWPQARGL